MKYYAGVEIPDPYKAKKCRTYLSFQGLKWNGVDSYTGMVSAFKFNLIKRYCDSKRIKCFIANEMGIRGTSYRRDFFANNRPVDNMGRYRCVYCGRKMLPQRITVDHIYPIGAVRSDIRLQKRLNRKGITNINDVKNLVPACMKCNKKKGTDMGIWILRAKLGKNETLWKIRFVIRIALGCIAIYFLFKFFSICFVF